MKQTAQKTAQLIHKLDLGGYQAVVDSNKVHSLK